MILIRLINTKRKYFEQNPLVDNFSGWRTLELWINLSFQILDAIGPLNKSLFGVIKHYYVQQAEKYMQMI